MSARVTASVAGCVAQLLVASAHAEPELIRDEQVEQEPLLPESFQVDPTSYWVVGVVGESATQSIDDGRDVRQVLLGLSTAFRHRWAGPHLRLMVTPHVGDFNELRLMTVGGFAPTSSSSQGSS